MKVKFANKVFEVLYTKEVAGLTMYAVEDEPNHVDWLINAEVVDNEKKELKKIEQNPAETVKWSPQEESCICQLESLVKEQWRQAERVHNSVNIKKMTELMFFLKTLNPNKKPQRIISAEAKEALYDKPAWSEEDEERLKSCLNILQAKGMMGVTDTINTKWLKSLKERIGG